MFKKMVKKILACANTQEMDEVCGLIDMNFQKGLLNWDEHEVLFQLINRFYGYMEVDE